MKRDQVNIQHYTRPEIRVLKVDVESLLQDTSNTGGHNNAGNGGGLRAKQGWFDEEEEDNNVLYKPYRVWEEE